MRMVWKCGSTQPSSIRFVVETLRRPREGGAEPHEQAAGQSSQGVGEAGIFTQPIAQDARKEGDGAEDEYAEEREEQSEGKKPQRSAARRRARELRQERQEEYRHLGVEKVHGQASEKEAPESCRRRLFFRANELPLTQKRSDSEVDQVRGTSVLDYRKSHRRPRQDRREPYSGEGGVEEQPATHALGRCESYLAALSNAAGQDVDIVRTRGDYNRAGEATINRAILVSSDPIPPRH